MVVFSFTSPPMSPEQIERILNEQHGTNIDDDDSSEIDNEIETTFGVDNTVETKVAKPNIYTAHVSSTQKVEKNLENLKIDEKNIKE